MLLCGVNGLGLVALLDVLLRIGVGEVGAVVACDEDVLDGEYDDDDDDDEEEDALDVYFVVVDFTADATTADAETAVTRDVNTACSAGDARRCCCCCCCCCCVAATTTDDGGRVVVGGGGGGKYVFIISSLPPIPLL